MYTIHHLPYDIIHLILYSYLQINDIMSCLNSSRFFHVLNSNEYKIIKNSYKGWEHCIKNGLVDAAKWYYQLNINLNSPIKLSKKFLGSRLLLVI